MLHTIVLLAGVFALSAEAAFSASSGYDPALAAGALGYCKATYCTPQEIVSWSGASCKYHPQFSEITLFTNNTYEMQGFPGYDPAAQQIVVAFRGTNNIINSIEDWKFKLVPYQNLNCSGCLVHEGFQQVWQGTKNDNAVIDHVQALMDRHPNASVLVTGHSLGSTTALLSALDIATSTTLGNRLKLYTYGEPRIGNAAFAAWVARVLDGGMQFRVVHRNDPIPHLPPEAFSYIHAPHELWYDNDGNATFISCTDTVGKEDPNCSNSVSPLQYSLHQHFVYLGISTFCTWP